MVVSILAGDEQVIDRGISGAELLAAPFIGVWADRDDIEDTAAFAEDLRKRTEGRD